ncbi:MAG: DUF4349 domain-containing protein [Candidatus Cryosericum sp.]
MNRFLCVRRLVVCVLLLAVMAALGGCAKRSSYSTSTGALDQGAFKGAPEASTTGSGTAASLTVDRKIIFTSDLTIDVSDAEQSLKNAETLAMKYGGFVAQSSLQRSDTQVKATAVLRVPAAKVSQVTDELAALGTVTGRSSGSEDVTSTYIDVQARLKVLRAEEEQLVAFLKKATTIKDMLAVQEQLRTVRTEIEQYEGQQRYMDNATSLASISVQLVQTTAAFVTPKGFGSAFAQSLARFGQGLRAFWTWLGGSLVFLVFYGLLALGLCMLVLRVIHRRGRRGVSGQS